MFIFKVPTCRRGTLLRHAIGFQVIFHPAVLVGHTKNSVLGVGFDTLQHVCVCGGLPCFVSTSCQTAFNVFFLCCCVFVLTFFSFMVLVTVHCCTSMRSTILTVRLLTFFLLTAVLAPILVATLVSRRYSMLRVWSQRKNTLL